jgi:ankyrin repeat protein
MPAKLLSAILLTAVCGLAADTRLADAVQAGDRNQVRNLLAQKVDVNAAQGDGATALHWAAFNDDLETAQVLLAAGANVKAATRVGAITPLFMASKNGNAAMIALLLKSGADPNSTDEHGTTALMTAAASGNAAAVETLIEHGADVNAREGAHGQTALMFAAALNRAGAITVLLNHRADSGIATKAVKLPKPPPRNDDGSPVLEGSKEAKGASGAAPAGDPKADLNALAAAIGLKSAVYTTGGKPAEADLREMVRKLTVKVDEVEKRLPSDKSKSEEGAISQNGFFRERGTTDMGGMTALLFAARDGQVDAARALLEGGADINQVSASEKTSPLVLSVMNGHFDLAKLLIDWGADPNLSNNQGLTALYAAIDVQWAPKGWFPAPGTGQEKVTYLDLMKTLLDDGADPNARLGKKLWFRAFGDHSWVDTAGATAFWRAAQSTDLPAMKLLVAHGADPDIASTGGDTPLMVASGIGWGYHYSMNALDSTWMDAVKYCIELGANVNAVDTKGYTALHGAAYLGNAEMINYLIDHGGDVKAVAKDKNTVADMANGPTRFGIPHPETVALLEKLGSANSHNCRSDQCLVAPKEDKKTATPTPAVAVPTPPTAPPAAPPASSKNGGGVQ